MPSNTVLAAVYKLALILSFLYSSTAHHFPWLLCSCALSCAATIPLLMEVVVTRAL
jgi:hypothetical protein